MTYGTNIVSVLSTTFVKRLLNGTAFHVRSAIAFCPFIERPDGIFADALTVPMQLLQSLAPRTTWILGPYTLAFLYCLTVGPARAPKAYAAGGDVDSPHPSCHRCLHCQRRSAEVG